MSKSSAGIFLVGLPLGAMVVGLASGGLEVSFASPPVMLLVRLLVGIETRLGSGCTSGHGVCGVRKHCIAGPLFPILE
ncbi:YeeE/YedE family protein [Pontixanthobacter gangjinensis]|uniref:Sulphur transport domain-containing protein n=1 Tax=Pontixanthobacter gangjinensis TaxID=1028742 RepID=A0A6I4SQY2_9SPHN|nr:hypothetical protein [Pontixanthobacter gangjinensis]MXO57257.1 hypothetical protein [Pontixanthobacter gangjinensis]